MRERWGTISCNRGGLERERERERERDLKRKRKRNTNREREPKKDRACCRERKVWRGLVRVRERGGV